MPRDTFSGVKGRRRLAHTHMQEERGNLEMHPEGFAGRVLCVFTFSFCKHVGCVCFASNKAERGGGGGDNQVTPGWPIRGERLEKVLGGVLQRRSLALSSR